MENAKIVSKVLIIDDGDTETLHAIKQFCDDNSIVAMKPHGNNVMRVLYSHVDLGGIFLSENYQGYPKGAIELAKVIHATRPEVPIFLRRENEASFDDMDGATRSNFSAAYTIDAIDALKDHLADYIFSFAFPNVMVRGIQEITEEALKSQFKHHNLSCDTPYLVKDAIVCGEVFTLIPLESNWCRGYMMLQCDNRLVQQGSTFEPGTRPLRMADVLGEVTNMVWGSFKTRYVSDEDQRLLMSQIQVPMMVKLNEREISFGSSTPQLCLQYTLTDSDNPNAQPVRIHQRFVFNLQWNPEAFKEVERATTEELVDAGELEFF